MARLINYHNSSCIGPPRPERPARQQGFALAISLVMLVVVTLLVLASLRGATLEERMAGNQRDRQLAFQSTEASIRTAASLLVGQSIWDYDSSCTNGLCAMDSAPDSRSYNWSSGTKHRVVDRTASDSMVSADIAANPGYYVENTGFVKSAKAAGGWAPVYRVTARSTGKNDTTQFFAQSVHRQQ